MTFALNNQHLPYGDLFFYATFLPAQSFPHNPLPHNLFPHNLLTDNLFSLSIPQPFLLSSPSAPHSILSRVGLLFSAFWLLPILDLACEICPKKSTFVKFWQSLQTSPGYLLGHYKFYTTTSNHSSTISSSRQRPGKISFILKFLGLLLHIRRGRASTPENQFWSPFSLSNITNKK